jgi:uncharacterized protein YkwD
MSRRGLTVLVAACLCAAAAMPAGAAAGLLPPLPVPLPPTPQVPACTDAAIAVTAASVARVDRGVLCLLNAQRGAHGLAPLRANRSLRRAASSYAAAMVRRRFFAHVSPSGSTVVSRVAHTSYLSGASTWGLGEDIAWGTGVEATPAGIVAAWMASAPHRRNILEPSFRDVGIGTRRGAPQQGVRGGATYVADFGTRTR